MNPQPFLSQHLYAMAGCGILSIVTFWIAYEKGFYKKLHSQEVLPLKLKHLVCCFAIYFFISFGFSLLFLQAIKDTLSPILKTSILQTLVSVSLAIFLYSYGKTLPGTLFKRIWKSGPSSLGVDGLIGCVAWMISFPVVCFVNQFCEFVTWFFFGIEPVEQMIVKYLKLALSTPIAFILLLIPIIIAAPLIEEFLFRGILQNYFKKHLGIKAAILLSSLIFALFHIALSQKLGNLPTLTTLFVLALYLGYVYERQRSLFASMTLHSIFNLVSVLRIVFKDI